MKISYFSSKFPYCDGDKCPHPYPYGGSVIATYHLAIEIARRGYEVKVFTSSSDHNFCEEIHGNLRVLRYGTDLRLLTSSISLGMFYKPLAYTSDIAHLSFDIPPAPLAGLRYAKKMRVPLVVTYHGDWEASYGNAARRAGIYLNNRLMVDRILSNAKIIISPSNIYIEMSKFLRKYSNKVHVIPNGIDLNTFDISLSKEECRRRLGLPFDKKIILYFGYLSPYKSPDILLRAFPKIIKKTPGALLIFAGMGVMSDELKRLSVDLGVAKQISFMGFVEDSLKPLFFKSADVFCLPSTLSTECYPLAILESMACNIPVVASKVGGIPEIIKEGETGLLTPPGNVDQLANSISYLLNNKDLCERMGRNARKVIKDYSWNSIAKETEAIYEKVFDEL